MSLEFTGSSLTTSNCCSEWCSTQRFRSTNMLLMSLAPVTTTWLRCVTYVHSCHLTQPRPCRCLSLAVDLIITGPPTDSVRGQTSNDGWCLSSVVVVVCNATGGRAGRPPGAWAVGRPTLHCGPVRLRPVRTTPFCNSNGMLPANIDRLQACSKCPSSGCCRVTVDWTLFLPSRVFP